jgi:hypothetical protein
MDASELLKVCAEQLGSGHDGQLRPKLQDWWRTRREQAAPLAEQLLTRGEPAWTEEILRHRAHRHPWYEQLVNDVSLQAYAAFMLENWAFPAFLPLVERALSAQISEPGRAAVLRNIQDEQIPVPHTELMRRLMGAIKARAGHGLRLESFPTLVDRTLVFYYGYHCDAWHLIGSLYATEAMAHHRMTKMGAGLERLGFSSTDLEYISIHLNCDDHHASDWSDEVVLPSIALNPELRIPIAYGIASCLETSARYLDDLSLRVCKTGAEP